MNNTPRISVHWLNFMCFGAGMTALYLYTGDGYVLLFAWLASLHFTRKAA